MSIKSINCAWCEETFKPEHKATLYCSRNCRAMAARQREKEKLGPAILKCRTCGDQFARVSANDINCKSCKVDLKKLKDSTGIPIEGKVELRENTNKENDMIQQFLNKEAT